MTESNRLPCQVCGKHLTVRPDGLARKHGRENACPGVGYQLDRWPEGQLLRHHAGSVWRVLKVNGPFWRGNYLLECVHGTYRESTGYGEKTGAEMNAHAEYMHRHGWTPITPEATTDQTQEAVADPKKDPAVDPVLFSLCVERVARSMVDDRATPLDRPLTVVVTPKAFAKYTVDLIAPLLLEAGAKAEREKFQARIERQRVLAYDAYRECEVQYDRETNAGESHEKVNEERMQVLDDTCGALWCLLNEPDEEDGEPDDWVRFADVEARLEAAEELARFAEWSFEGDDDAIVFCPPEMEDSTRAALARFRSTGGTE